MELRALLNKGHKDAGDGVPPLDYMFGKVAAVVSPRMAAVEAAGLETYVSMPVGQRSQKWKAFQSAALNRTQAKTRFSLVLNDTDVLVRMLELPAARGTSTSGQALAAGAVEALSSEARSERQRLDTDGYEMIDDAAHKSTVEPIAVEDEEEAEPEDAPEPVGRVPPETSEPEPGPLPDAPLVAEASSALDQGYRTVVAAVDWATSHVRTLPMALGMVAVAASRGSTRIFTAAILIGISVAWRVAATFSMALRLVEGRLAVVATEAASLAGSSLLAWMSAVMVGGVVVAVARRSRPCAPPPSLARPAEEALLKRGLAAALKFARKLAQDCAVPLPSPQARVPTSAPLAEAVQSPLQGQVSASQLGARGGACGGAVSGRRRARRPLVRGLWGRSRADLGGARGQRAASRRALRRPVAARPRFPGRVDVG